MTLTIIDWLNRTFQDMEEFFMNHYSNPILWIAIMIVILAIVAMAANILRGKR